MKTQFPPQQSSGRHFGTHAIVKFERRSARSPRSIAQKLRRFFANLFPVTAEPRIREAVTSTGDRRWIVYDANRGCKLKFDSEQAVLEWLDSAPQPKTRFEQIWSDR